MENSINETGYPAWLVRVHRWRTEHVSDKMFLLLLAFVVGVLAAVAAEVLHGLINQIVALLTGHFEAESYNWLYLVYPVIGIWLTSLFVRHVVYSSLQSIRRHSPRTQYFVSGSSIINVCCKYIALFANSLSSCVVI